MISKAIADMVLRFLFGASAIGSSLNLWTDEFEKEVYTRYAKDVNAYVSEACFQRECWAKKLVSSKSISPIFQKTIGQKMDSLVLVCVQLNGSVVNLKQKVDKHQARFCMGPDRSLIDLNSLARLIPKTN